MNQNPFKYQYLSHGMKWVLLLLVLVLSFNPVTAEDALTLSIATDKKTYEAQGRGWLHITFVNNSGQTAEDINIKVDSQDLLFMTKTAAIDGILWGSKTVNFKFHCKDLEDGEYPVLIRYNYMITSKTCQGGVCQTVQDKTEYYITIKNGEPHISLETNTLTVVNDKTVITFKNSDEVALDFTFQLESSNVTLQYESYIGYLLSKSAKEIVVYGDPGEHDGSVRVEYRDRFGRVYEKTFLVRIIIEKEEEKVIIPHYSEQKVRKIEVTTVSEEPPVSQYYIYGIVLSCLSLIGVAVVAKVKNAQLHNSSNDKGDNSHFDDI